MTKKTGLLTALIVAKTLIAPASGWADCTQTQPALPLEKSSVDSLVETTQAVAAKYDVSVGIKDNVWFRTSLLQNDNFGDTYGYDISARKNNADGTHITAAISSDLYTQPISYTTINGGNNVIQKESAVNDNKYSLSYDNSGQHRLLYYSGTLGMQVLNCNAGNNFLYSSAQQTWFHKATDRDRQIVDVPCGMPEQKGAFAAAYVGVQDQKSLGHGFSLSGRADLGDVQSQVTGASYREAQAQASVTFQPGTVGVRLGVGFDGKFNSDASEKDGIFNLALLLGHKFEISADYERYGGKAVNYVQDNLVNPATGTIDPTLEIRVKKGF